MDTPEDEVLSLIARIIELRSRINSQIDSLNNAVHLDSNEKKETKVEEELR